MDREQYWRHLFALFRENNACFARFGDALPSNSSIDSFLNIVTNIVVNDGLHPDLVSSLEFVLIDLIERSVDIATNSNSASCVTHVYYFLSQCSKFYNIISSDTVMKFFTAHSPVDLIVNFRRFDNVQDSNSLFNYIRTIICYCGMDFLLRIPHSMDWLRKTMLDAECKGDHDVSSFLKRIYLGVPSVHQNVPQSECEISLFKEFCFTPKSCEVCSRPVMHKILEHKMRIISEDCEGCICESCGSFRSSTACWHPRIKTFEEGTFHKSTVEICGVLLPRICNAATDTQQKPKLEYVETETSVRNLAMLVRAIQCSWRPIILHGHSGCGKSHMIRYLAESTGNDSIELQVDDQFDPKMLIGMIACSDIPGTFVWKPGMLTEAMKAGSWVVIEDIDKVSIDVIAFLIPILERRELTVPGSGATVFAHPNFRVIGTRTLNHSNDNKTGRDGISGHGSFSNMFAHVQIESLPLNEVQCIVTCRNAMHESILSSLMASYDLLSSESDRLRLRMTLRDLIRCSDRISSICPASDVVYVSESRRTDCLREIYDVCLCRDNENWRSSLKCLSDLWQLDFDAVLRDILYRNPDLSYDRLSRRMTIGRSILTNVDEKDAAIESQLFCYSHHATRLMERISLCIERNEPVLLVGETGCGKTTAVQEYARLCKKKFAVFNLSTATDSSDLLGGFKPVEICQIIRKFVSRLEELISLNFDRKKNDAFLSGINNFYCQKKWKPLCKVLSRSIDVCIAEVETGMKRLTMTTADMERPIPIEYGSKRKHAAGVLSSSDSVSKRPRSEGSNNRGRSLKEWESLKQDFEKFWMQFDKYENSFAFSFQDGQLTDAVRNGKWILLDEINLGDAETLERLLGLLDGRSIVLSEKGDLQAIPIHPDFRLFAAMNPPTDIGKRDLPTSLRCRFLEIFVDEITDSVDLQMIVERYLAGIDNMPITDIVETYLELRRQSVSTFIDGAGSRPRFSLRTLCRALSAAKRFIGIGFERHGALVEGFELAFQTVLSSQHASQLHNFLLQRLTNGSLKETVPSVVNLREDQFIVIKPFYIKCGSVKKFNLADVGHSRRQSVVLTPSMVYYRRVLARAICGGVKSILLQGPTSAGKTTSVEYLALLSGNKCVRINNHEHTDIQEYIGSYVSDEHGKLVFRDGALTDAVRNGSWIILDELNLAPSDVLEALNRLLDDNHELFIPETSETLHCHPDFMLFATQNPPGVYGGRKALSRAFRNRFVEINVEQIPSDEMETILNQRCSMAPKYCKMLVNVMKELQILCQSSCLLQGRDNLVTPRDLIKWANRMPSNPLSIAEEGFMLLAERLRSEVDKKVVVKVLEDICKVKLSVDNIYAQCEEEEKKQFDSHSVDDIRAPGYSDLRRLCDDVENGSLSIDGVKSIRITSGLYRLWKLVGKCLVSKEPVLLVGETGCGKTLICQMMAAFARKKLCHISCHQNTETSDIIGSLRPIRDRESILADIQMLVEKLRSMVPPESILSDVNVAEMNFDDLVDVADKILRSLDDRCSDQNEDRKRKRNTASSQSHFDVLAVQEIREELGIKKKLYQSLFAWYDGSLVDAMKSGNYLLLDEISLAEDAVLERLNSVLEPSRTITLAEKGGIGADVVVADDGFRIMATMNPGGDFGKRELTPSLRSRFTEIWVPPFNDWGDVHDIISHSLTFLATDTFDRITHGMVTFMKEYNSLVSDICGPLHSAQALSIRDLLNWVEFMERMTESHVSDAHLREWSNFFHGARMVALDSIGLGSSMSATEQACCRQQLIEKFIRMICPEEVSRIMDNLDSMSEIILDTEFNRFGCSPFWISLGEHQRDEAHYSFLAPTTHENCKRVLRAMQTSRSILLEGSPGVGKTSLISCLAAMSGHNLVRINMSDQVDISDLMGSDLPTIDSNNQFSWCDGIFLKALKRGDWVLLDELNLAPQSVLEGLNSCLDHRSHVFIPEIGRKFQCHPSFRIFCAQNPYLDGGSRKGLPKSFLNRFCRMVVDPLNESDMLVILKEKYQAALLELLSCSNCSEKEVLEGIDGLLRTMVHFNFLVEEEIRMCRIGKEGSPWEFNLRDLFRWFDCMTQEKIVQKLAVASSERDGLSWAAFRVGIAVKEVSLLDISDNGGYVIGGLIVFPGLYIDTIYLQRMRNLYDRSKIVELFDNCFNTSLLIRNCSAIHVSSNYIQVGSAVIRKKSTKIGQKLRLEPALSRTAESVCRCVEMNFPLLLVSPHFSDCVDVVKWMAKSLGKSLVEIDFTASTDLSEILGGFEQSDLSRDFESLGKCILETVTFALQSDVAPFDALFDLLGILEAILGEELSSSCLLNLQAEMKNFEEIIKTCSLLSDCETALNIIFEGIDSLISRYSKNLVGGFSWVDSRFIQAVTKGNWVLLRNVNLCPSSVLDRLNSLLEVGGTMIMAERGGIDGEFRTVLRHADCHIFLSMDPSHGNVSRAMRNRCIEIYLNLPDLSCVSSDKALIRFRDNIESEKLIDRLALLGCSTVLQEFGSKVCRFARENEIRGKNSLEDRHVYCWMLSRLLFSSTAMDFNGLFGGLIDENLAVFTSILLKSYSLFGELLSMISQLSNLFCGSCDLALAEDLSLCLLSSTSSKRIGRLLTWFRSAKCYSNSNIHNLVDSLIRLAGLNEIIYFQRLPIIVLMEGIKHWSRDTLYTRSSVSMNKLVLLFVGYSCDFLKQCCSIDEVEVELISQLCYLLDSVILSTVDENGEFFVSALRLTVSATELLKFMGISFNGDDVALAKSVLIACIEKILVSLKTWGYFIDDFGLQMADMDFVPTLPSTKEAHLKYHDGLRIHDKYSLASNNNESWSMRNLIAELPDLLFMIANHRRDLVCRLVGTEESGMNPLTSQGAATSSINFLDLRRRYIFWATSSCFAGNLAMLWTSLIDRASSIFSEIYLAWLSGSCSDLSSKLMKLDDSLGKLLAFSHEYLSTTLCRSSFAVPIYKLKSSLDMFASRLVSVDEVVTCLNCCWHDVDLLLLQLKSSIRPSLDLRLPSFASVQDVLSRFSINTERRVRESKPLSNDNHCSKYFSCVNLYDFRLFGASNMTDSQPVTFDNICDKKFQLSLFVRFFVSNSRPNRVSSLDLVRCQHWKDTVYRFLCEFLCVISDKSDLREFGFDNIPEMVDRLVQSEEWKSRELPNFLLTDLVCVELGNSLLSADDIANWGKNWIKLGIARFYSMWGKSIIDPSSVKNSKLSSLSHFVHRQKLSLEQHSLEESFLDCSDDSSDLISSVKSEIEDCSRKINIEAAKLPFRSEKSSAQLEKIQSEVSLFVKSYLEPDSCLRLIQMVFECLDKIQPRNIRPTDCLNEIDAWIVGFDRFSHSLVEIAVDYEDIASSIIVVIAAIRHGFLLLTRSLSACLEDERESCISVTALDSILKSISGFDINANDCSHVPINEEQTSGINKMESFEDKDEPVNELFEDLFNDGRNRAEKSRKQSYYYFYAQKWLIMNNFTIQCDKCKVLTRSQARSELLKRKIVSMWEILDRDLAISDGVSDSRCMDNLDGLLTLREVILQRETCSSLELEEIKSIDGDLQFYLYPEICSVKHSSYMIMGEELSSISSLSRSILSKLQLVEASNDDNLVKIRQQVGKIANSHVSCKSFELMEELESLLEAISDWHNIGGACEALDSDVIQAQSLIMSCRKKELESWKGILRATEEHYCERSLKIWNIMYTALVVEARTYFHSSCIGAKWLTGKSGKQDLFEVSKLFDSVDAFLRSSCIGEYPTRLHMVRSFAADLMSRKNKSLGTMIANMWKFYSQFSIFVTQSKQLLSDEVLKKLHGLISLFRWDNHTFSSFMQSSKRSQKQIMELVKKYSEILDTPVFSLIKRVLSKDIVNPDGGLVPSAEIPEASSMFPSLNVWKGKNREPAGKLDDHNPVSQFSFNAVESRMQVFCLYCSARSCNPRDVADFQAPFIERTTDLISRAKLLVSRSFSNCSILYSSKQCEELSCDIIEGIDRLRVGKLPKNVKASSFRDLMRNLKSLGISNKRSNVPEEFRNGVFQAMLLPSCFTFHNLMNLNETFAEWTYVSHSRGEKYYMRNLGEMVQLRNQCSVAYSEDINMEEASSMLGLSENMCFSSARLRSSVASLWQLWSSSLKILSNLRASVVAHSIQRTSSISKVSSDILVDFAGSQMPLQCILQIPIMELFNNLRGSCHNVFFCLERVISVTRKIVSSMSDLDGVLDKGFIDNIPFLSRDGVLLLISEFDKIANQLCDVSKFVENLEDLQLQQCLDDSSISTEHKMLTEGGRENADNQRLFVMSSSSSASLVESSRDFLNCLSAIKKNVESFNGFDDFVFLELVVSCDAASTQITKSMRKISTMASNISELDDCVEMSISDEFSNEIKCEANNLCRQILLAFQKLFNWAPDLPSSDINFGCIADTISSHVLDFVDNNSIVHCATMLVERWHSKWNQLSELAMSRKVSKSELQSHRDVEYSIIFPLVELHSFFCQACFLLMDSLTVFYGSMGKLGYINLRLFRNLLAKGYCVGDDEESKNDDKTQPPSADEFEGTGMGDGVGKNDVSDQIENEDQLLGLQEDQMKKLDDLEKNSKEKKQDQGNPPPEDDGIEMTDDFDGDLFDVKQDDENEPEAQDNVEELDREMGELEKNEGDAVDESLWNSKPEDAVMDSETHAHEQKSVEDQLTSSNIDEEKSNNDKPKENQGHESEETDAGQDQEDSVENNDVAIGEAMEVDDNGSETSWKSQSDDGDGEGQPMEEDDETGSDVNAQEVFNEIVEEDVELDADAVDEQAAIASEEIANGDPEIPETDQGDVETADDSDHLDNQGNEPEEKSPVLPDQIGSSSHGSGNAVTDDKEAEDDQQEDATTENESAVEHAADSSTNHDKTEKQPNPQTDKNDDNSSSTKENEEKGKTSDMSFGTRTKSKNDPARVDNQKDKRRKDFNKDNGKGNSEEEWFRDLIVSEKQTPLDDSQAKEALSKGDTDKTQTFETVPDDQPKSLDEMQALIPDDEKSSALNYNGQKDVDIEDNLAKDDDLLNIDESHEIDEKEEDGSNTMEVADDVESQIDQFNDSAVMQPASRHKQYSAKPETPMILDISVMSEAVQSGNKADRQSRVVMNFSSGSAERYSKSPAILERKTQDVDDSISSYGAEVWKTCRNVTMQHSSRLCEQLRTILEPQQASKLEGDYRSGKRINMKKIIPYIASGFRKDKIWMRRSKAAKRCYQIMLLLDNSSSMRDAGNLALASTATLAGALNQLEVGQLCCAVFSDSFHMVHPFNETFSDSVGARIASSLTFDSSQTLLAASLESCATVLDEARECLPSSCSSSSSCFQILMIISDARIDTDNRSRLKCILRDFKDKHVLVLLIILDHNDKDSILRTKQVQVLPNKGIKLVSYFDEFPFPFYVVIRQIDLLPEVISDAMRQWFEMIRNV